MQSVAVSGRLVRHDRVAREAEEERLASAAMRSKASRGRVKPESPDEFRTAFERDRDRILHSKAFRRLKHKTQVFINPEGDHFVTRLTHTLQVTQISRSLAAALSLNEALAEAIALGHDVGHSPFGQCAHGVRVATPSSVTVRIFPRNWSAVQRDRHVIGRQPRDNRTALRARGRHCRGTAVNTVGDSIVSRLPLTLTLNAAPIAAFRPNATASGVRRLPVYPATAVPAVYA